MARESISIEEYIDDPIVWTCIEYDSCHGESYDIGRLAYELNSVWTVMTGLMNDGGDKSFQMMKHAKHDSVNSLKKWIHENEIDKKWDAAKPSTKFENWYKQTHLPSVNRLEMPDERVDTGTVYIYKHSIFRDKWLALQQLFRSNDWVSQGIKTYNIDTQTYTATWYPMNLTDDELDKIAQSNDSLKASIEDIKNRRTALLSRAQAIEESHNKAIAANPHWVHHAMI